MTNTASIAALHGVTLTRRVYPDDLDAFGVLYHARYVSLIDHAITDWWVDAGWRLDLATTALAVRSLELAYEVPVSAPSDVAVRFRIERRGTTSIPYAFEVTSVDGSVVHAHGRRTLVNVDTRTGRPAPVDDALWRLAAPLLPA